ITGGYIALVLALRKANLERAITSKIAAISVGIVEDAPLLDLEYREDSGAEVDFNVIGTDAGAYVELQGTAEGKAFDRSQMDALLDLADGGLKTLFGIQEAVLKGEAGETGKAAE
ncbi:MAG: ribonuclease PH, partial [Chloroflexota bacterium]|nr:ribonuclease PH [Chloroflexota bacterium]